MKNKYTHIIVLIGLLVAVFAARAQPGGWSVNPADFQFSMSMVAQIETGGAPNNALDNHVAAFSGNQIRGYAKPVQIGNQACYFLNLFANTYLNDKLYFLAFIGGENRVYESTDTVAFLHLQLIGDIQNPFVLHFTLSPKPLIYSLANVNYFESNCTPGPLLDVQASDDQDSEGNGLKYHIVGGADSSRFKIDSLTGVMNWKNFVPDFENPQDADANNSYVVAVRVRDLGGNQSTQTITVQVKDDPVPTAGCPPAITANTSDDGTGDCGTAVNGALSVTIPGGCAIYPVSYVLEGATTGQGDGQLPAGQVFGAGKTTVRYTVTDEAGALSSACSFTVTVTDDEDPALTCPANIAVNTDPDTCIAVPSGTALSVTDNCLNPEIKFTLSGAAQGTGNGQLPVDQAFVPGVTTVTYSVRDDLNQPASTCSFTVTVTDNVPPTVTCPDNISVTLSTGCSDTQTATAATVDDNCSGVVLNYQLSGATNGSGTGQILGGQKFQAGLTTAVYTATDGSGQSSCSFTILLRETKKPGITCPANTSITVSANCEAPLPDYLATVQVSDNCTPDSALALEQQPVAGTILQGNSMTTVQLTVTDLSGNTKSCTFTVTVADLNNVQITCPPNQEVCTGVIGNYTALATVLTGCSGSGTVTVNQFPAPNTTIPALNGQTAVTLTATEGSNSTSCMFTVSWKDTSVPNALCKDASVVIQPNSQASVAASDINNNSTDNCGVQNLSLNTTTFTCDHLGANIVTLTVTDVYGLTNTCTATVTVNDPNAFCCAPPRAICKTNPVITLGNAGQAAVTVADIDNGSTYACGLQFIEVSPNTVNCTDTGTPLTVTLTVTDTKNNSSSCTATVTVRDVDPPSVVCPADQTVSADGNCSAAVGVWAALSVSDMCTASGSVSVTQNPPANTLFSGHDVIRTVVLTATDASFNTASCFFTLTLKDISPPTVRCKNTTADLQQVPFVGSQATIAASDVLDAAADNCGTVGLSVSPDLFTCGTLGDHTVTLTATDQQGYTATCQATVTVRDVTRPKITCPANQTLAADAGCSGLLGEWLAVSKSDNCTPSTAVAVTQNPGSSAALSGHDDVRTVTLTATDASANTATCTFTVTLKDESPPSLLCKNASVNLDNSGVGGLGAATVFSSGSDNCGMVNPVSVTPASFSCANLGTQIVVLVVNDGHGNTASCTASVQIVDAQKPVFTYVPPGVTVQCDAVPGPGIATATDNCSVTVTYDGQMIADGNCPGNYVITRLWTATDGSNNTQTATQRITVQDTQSPVFIWTPAALTVECSNIPSAGMPAAIDNCDPAVTMTYNGETLTKGACADSYVLTRQWTAADHCGNTRTATQRITVRDTKAPLFTSVPAFVTVECSNVPTVGMPSATDNCDTQVEIVYLGATVAQGACPDTYVLTRRWKATDNCGNTRSASQKITVRDQTKPVFTSVPAAVTIECTDPVPPVGAPAATDNCDASVTITYLGEDGVYQTCVNTHQLVRTWRAADNCGNWTTATQVITVQDTQPPVFTNVPQHITIQCSEPVPFAGTPTATDACAGYVQITFLGQTNSPGSCQYNYSITRTWRAQDECGNAVTATQTITVQDTQAPAFNNPPIDMMVYCNDIPSEPVLTAQDNCGPATVTYQGETQTPGDCDEEYAITRTWTAEDGCGNIRTLTQTLVVLSMSPFGPENENRDMHPAPANVFGLHPNPTTDWLTFDLGELPGERARLAVHNLLGDLEWERQLDALREPYVQVSLRQIGLAEGLYLVLVESAGIKKTLTAMLVR